MFITHAHRELVRTYGTLYARIIVGFLFITAGIGKIGSGYGFGGGYEGTVQYLASTGLPMPELLVLAAIVLEIGGGLGVLLGYYFAESAAALVFVCFFTAFFLHNDFTNGMQKTMFFKNITIAGGLLYMIAFGPGNGWKYGTKD